MFKVLLIMLCRPNYVSISCTFTDIVRANIVDLEIRVGVVPGHCLSNAMHGQNINLRVCLCVRHTFCQLAYRSDPSTDFYS